MEKFSQNFNLLHLIVHFLVSGLKTVQTGHGVGAGFTFEEFESPCFARPLDTGMVRGSPNCCWEFPSMMGVNPHLIAHGHCLGQPPTY